MLYYIHNCTIDLIYIRIYMWLSDDYMLNKCVFVGFIYVYRFIYEIQIIYLLTYKLWILNRHCNKIGYTVKSCGWLLASGLVRLKWEWAVTLESESEAASDTSDGSGNGAAGAFDVDTTIRWKSLKALISKLLYVYIYRNIYYIYTHRLVIVGHVLTQHIMR